MTLRPLLRSSMSLRAEGNAVRRLLLAKLAMVIQVRNAASLISVLLRIQSGVWVNTVKLGAHDIVASSLSVCSSVVTVEQAPYLGGRNYGHVTRWVEVRW
jgi:hypothetical protein